jgi:hypothetical protein
MQRAAALQGIEGMRFNVRPKSNQLTAIGNAMDGFAEGHSRRVEAAAAASTQAGQREIKDAMTGNHHGRPRDGKLRNVIILSADFVDQLDFEFAGNKNSMNVLMNRLRRVYRD